MPWDSFTRHIGPDFYDDLVHKFRKKYVGKAKFSDQFGKNVICSQRNGFKCCHKTQSRLTTLLTSSTARRLSWSVFRLYDGPKLNKQKLLILIFCPPVIKFFFVFCSCIPVVLFDTPEVSQHVVSVELSSLL